MKKEKWKTLKGFKNVTDNKYQISNHGNVRKRKSKELLHLKIACKKKHPYHAVYLKQNSGKKEWVLVHQLVAYLFLEIPEKYIGQDVELVPDHLDNDGLNNYYENLKWKTRGENVSDAFKMGYCNNSGENSKHAIITDKEAHQICKYFCDNLSNDEILDLMGYPKNNKYRTLLTRIKNRLAWNHVSNHYIYEKCSGLTDKHRAIIEVMPRIKEFISNGLSNTQIYEILWKGDGKRESKMELLRGIRSKRVYKKYL